MKKAYTPPVATEEVFVANNYIAACQTSTKSTSTANKMQCINPSHPHSMTNGGHYYFAGVWVSADTNGCDIVVTPGQKTSYTGNWETTYGTKVYSKEMGAMVCNIRRGNIYSRYYVPSNLTYCYGAYINNGTYEEITQKLNS